MNLSFAGIHALIFFGSALLLLILETFRRSQREPVKGRERWIVNLSLMLVVSMGGTLIFAAGPLDIAQAQQQAGESGWNLPLVVEILLVFLLLDFWRYWEHRVFHEVPLLWRVHLVHHSDTFVDVTTAERHHPFEALLTLPLAAILVLALGLPPAGLMLYMIIAGMSALFTHANVRLPDRVDRRLRRVLVTPSVHAIHHGSTPALADSNYGAVFSCWDRMFGTYSDPETTRVDHFGLEYFHRRSERTLVQTLLQPFLYRAKMTAYEREPDELAAVAAITLGPTWVRALTLLGLILAFSGLAMWPTVVNLTSIWASTESYQYAWLVVPFFVYAMGWHYREELLRQTPQPDAAGLLLTAVALLLWSAAALVQIDLLQHIALVILLQGIFLAVLGRGLWLRFLPVFLVLLFMIPSGDVLEFPLRVLTLDMIVFFCQLVDLPYVLDGFRINVGDNNYVVLNACSGLSFVLLAMFLSYSLGSLLYRNLFKVVGLTMLGGLLGIVANGLRVNAIVWVDWISGTQMDLGAHQEYQLLALIFMLGGIFLVLSRLSLEAPTEKVTPTRPVEPSSLARYSPAAVAMTIGPDDTPTAFQRRQHDTWRGVSTAN